MAENSEMNSSSGDSTDVDVCTITSEEEVPSASASDESIAEADPISDAFTELQSMVSSIRNEENVGNLRVLQEASAYIIKLKDGLNNMTDKFDRLTIRFAESSANFAQLLEELQEATRMLQELNIQ